jgi:hypothetical protein
MASSILRELDRFACRLSALSAHDLERPPACEGWSVQDLVRHHVSIPAFYACIVDCAQRGQQPPEAELTVDSTASAASGTAAQEPPARVGGRDTDSHLPRSARA